MIEQNIKEAKVCFVFTIIFGLLILFELFFGEISIARLWIFVFFFYIFINGYRVRNKEIIEWRKRNDENDKIC